MTFFVPYLTQSVTQVPYSGHGLAGMVVLGGWLDSMIVEVFSNLNDSVIRCAKHCESAHTHTSVHCVIK